MLLLLLLRSVDYSNWMLMRMSFRVFSPNACVGFFCEILDLEEKNVHTSSANAQCSLVEKGCS